MNTGIISPFSFNANAISPKNNIGFHMQSTRHFCTLGLRLFIVNAQGKVRACIWHASLRRAQSRSWVWWFVRTWFVRTRPFKWPWPGNKKAQEFTLSTSKAADLSLLPLSLCSRTLKKMIFALCSISLIKMSSYNITLGKNGPNLILLNINNVI